MTVPRYDGVSAWYDEYQARQAREVTEYAGLLVHALLPPGKEAALDLGCGTGRHYGTLRALGYDVSGIDVSADQLQRAHARGEPCARADATSLPFAAATFKVVATIMTATDFEDLRAVLLEARRVATDSGVLVLVLSHPCFGQVFQEENADGSVTVYPGYRDHRWFADHPLLGDGIRRRVGTMNVPLPALLNAVSEAGWQVNRVEEDQRLTAVPILLGIRAYPSAIRSQRFP